VDLSNLHGGLGAAGGYVSVEDHGALPNGVDCTEKIQMAIDTAQSEGKFTFIPPGTYTTSGALTIYTGSRIVGAGSGITTIRNLTSNVFTTSLVGAETHSDGLEVSHLGFLGPNNSTNSQVAILLDSCRNARLNDIYVRQFRHAVKLTDASYWNSVRDLMAYRCGTMVRLDDSASKCNANRFYNLLFEDSGLWDLDAIEICGYGNHFFGVYATYPGANSIIRFIAVNAGQNEFFGLYGEGGSLSYIVDQGSGGNGSSPTYQNHVWGYWDDGVHTILSTSACTTVQVLQQNKLLEWTTVPASAGATGRPGQVAQGSNFLYVCTAVNTWERVATATW